MIEVYCFALGVVVGCWWYSRSLRKEIAEGRAAIIEAKRQYNLAQTTLHAARRLHDDLRAYCSNKTQ